MDTDEALTRADAEALLAYAQVTYTAVTQQRRRLATAFLAVALLFAALALLSGVKWAATTSQIDDVEDATLIDTLGVRVPDPRPAFERTELRIRAFGWGVVAAGTGLIALLAGGMFALVRPGGLPPELRALQERRQPTRPPE